jgi:hypothetical protein
MTPIASSVVQTAALGASSPALASIPMEVVVGLVYTAIAASGVVTLRTLDQLRASNALSFSRACLIHARHLFASAVAVASALACMYGSLPALAGAGLIYASLLAWSIVDMVRSGALPRANDPPERGPFWQMPARDVFLPGIARNRRQAEAPRPIPERAGGPRPLNPAQRAAQRQINQRAAQRQINEQRRSPDELRERAEVAPYLEQTVVARTDDVLGADGNAGAAQVAAPTPQRTRAACVGLSAAIQRFVLGPGVPAAARAGAAFAHAAARAQATLTSMNNISNEIAAPLIAAWELLSDLEEQARRQGRPLLPAEHDRIMVGLSALIEGLQHCSGAWSAHMQMVADGFRGESVSDRNWILRQLAQWRYALVADYFRERPQQVHYINQLRYLLWRDHRIALPGASIARRDWYVGDQNHTGALVDLRERIDAAQDPIGIVAFVRKNLNHPSNQARCVSLQNALAVHHAQSAQIRGQIQPLLIPIFEAPLAGSDRPQEELLAEANRNLAQIEQQMDDALPGARPLLHLIVALQQGATTNEQIEQARLAVEGTPGISERLRNAVASQQLSAEHRAGWQQALQRTLMIEKTRAPRFQPLENRWREERRNRSVLEADRLFLEQIARNQNLTLDERQTLAARIQQLSAAFEEQGWPSLREMVSNASPDQAQQLLRALAQEARTEHIRAQFQLRQAERADLSRQEVGRPGTLRHEVEELLCRQVARREVLEEFVNEQVSVPGVIRILQMLGLLQVQ